jgi:hypothetical protein
MTTTWGYKHKREKMKSTSVLVVVAIVLASFAGLPPAEAAKGLDVSLQDCGSSPALCHFVFQEEHFVLPPPPN